MFNGSGSLTAFKLLGLFFLRAKNKRRTVTRVGKRKKKFVNLFRECKATNPKPNYFFFFIFFFLLTASWRFLATSYKQQTLQKNLGAYFNFPQTRI